MTKPKRHEPEPTRGPFVVTVNPGEEVISLLQAHIIGKQIRHASILLIGAVDLAIISVMRLDDARRDVNREYRAPAELTGTGEVLDQAVHLHVTLAMEDQTVAGHLLAAQVGDNFVRAYVTPLAEDR